MFQFDQVVIDMIWKGIRETLFMTLVNFDGICLRFASWHCPGSDGQGRHPS